MMVVTSSVILIWNECVGTTETLLLIRNRIGCHHRSISLDCKLQLCMHVYNLADV